MSSSQRVATFAAALTDVVQWLEYKTFGRGSWYDRACLLLREASDVAPSLDDLKLAEARSVVRSALTEKVLTTHPPDLFFEELAMPVSPVGATIYASELDELDTISGKDYVLQAARVEEKWAEADALWREKVRVSSFLVRVFEVADSCPKAGPKATVKTATRPRPTPKVAPPASPPSPAVPSKRKNAPLSSDEEHFSPAPARSGTQKLVPSSLFALTSGRLIVGKTPAPKKATKKPAGRPERAVRRSRPALAVETDIEDDAQYEDDFSDSKPNKRESGRAAKRSKGAKAEKEAFPDEDPTAEVSDWFVYQELRKCVKCAASRAPGGVDCRMYRGENRCRRCRRTAQGCYWEISPGAIPVSYSGAHKQSRDPAAVATPSSHTNNHSQLLPASTLFVAHSEAARPVFRVDAISYVEEVPSCLASLRRRAALARIHPDSQPASRAIADVVEQSLANAQVQLSTGLLLARSLLRDSAPGFRGADADPAELEEPLDDDLPVDFTEDPDHPISFRMEVTPPVLFDGPPSPLRRAESVEPYPRASSRSGSDDSSDTESPKLPSTVIEVGAEGSGGRAEGVEESGPDTHAGSGGDDAEVVV
ncbi:hypothetical protein EUX98_g8680 [Antrodiella citrinella]|uniref:Uncharacterized protein n=1 Tax=Antrodiella citrinella TaxID=2447956 RepID=A0A4S4MAE2_9APHY|nr:hypothetical protein EUX98_g8680 [Antrodiella citrinella]